MPVLTTEEYENQQKKSNKKKPEVKTPASVKKAKFEPDAIETERTIYTLFHPDTTNRENKNFIYKVEINDEIINLHVCDSILKTDRKDVYNYLIKIGFRFVKEEKVNE